MRLRWSIVQSWPWGIKMVDEKCNYSPIVSQHYLIVNLWQICLPLPSIPLQNKNITKFSKTVKDIESQKLLPSIYSCHHSVCSSSLYLPCFHRQYSIETKLETYLKIAQLYLEDEDHVQAEIYLNRASLLHKSESTQNEKNTILYEVKHCSTKLFQKISTSQSGYCGIFQTYINFLPGISFATSPPTYKTVRCWSK